MNKTTYNKIIRRYKQGETLSAILDDMGIPYSTYRRFVIDNELEPPVRRGRPSEVYTLEKVREVQRRYKQGGFLKDICEDLGMNFENFCRFCRNKGIKVLTDKQRRESYDRRKKTGKKKAAKKKAAKKGAKKKAAKKKKVNTDNLGGAAKRIVKMLQTGRLSQSDIANRTGVSPSYVSALKKKHL